MERKPDDAGYIDYLGTNLRRRQYYNWRERMLPRVEDIAASFKNDGFDSTMARFSLTRRDAVLLKRLRYLDDSEIPPELVAMEKEMPL